MTDNAITRNAKQLADFARRREGDMSEREDIVKRLMDYNRCHDGDVDEAADEITTLRARLAEAKEAAQWLLYDAPGRPYTEVEAFVRERPWLKEGQP